ncbi:acidic tetraheme cytochrome c3 TmcA [Desulfovibrio oxyclinae]|uniref:acidic tetraheme cytochrome c3 TmcA n=1 Tax=Desulfovibrio oxyclinae TaxID=63560 RepID=UPI000382191F|nr:cytochrome c3 family protein [Desulfovibrio oxyclinae]
MNKIVPALLAAVLVLVFFLPAMGQEDIVELSNPAFTENKRPAAVFNHDEHNEMAEIYDCTPCHHEGVEEGEFIPGDPEMGCADCHYEDAGEGETPLREAYHQMCIDCHTEKKVGPVACGQCHVN